MAEIKYKKEKVTATVSPHVRKRIDEYVASEEFSSVSDFVNTALAYFLGKLDYQKELEAAAKEPTQVTDERDQLLIDVIKKLVENPELLSSIKEQTKSGASKKNMNLSPILLKENRSANKTIKKKEKNAAETSAQTPENLLQKRPEKQQKPKHIIELSVGRKKNLKR